MTTTRDNSTSARRRIMLAVLAGAVVVSGLTIMAGAPAQAAACRQFQAKDEPPCNPALPDSPWGVSHRNSWSQASSPYPGLASAKVRFQHVDLPGIPVQIQFSNRYRSGDRAAWGSLVSNQGEGGLFKADERTGKLIDLYIPAQREPNAPKPTTGGITGSYNILDRDGHFIVPRQREIEVYGDAKQGRLHSKIKLIKRYRLPAGAFCRADDRIAGATMTYDGSIAFATELGVTGTIPRQPKQMRNRNLRTISFNGSKCADTAVPDSKLEQVSNSIAADQSGGIYVVTSKKMRRVNHDDGRNTLTKRWEARYDAGSSTSAIRLGVGSGSTPTVMGTGKQDKFVVITDGQDLMHVDLFWRNRIPKDWQGKRDRSRRMACEYPVRFGDPKATTSLSEQSVTVRGNATFHVNNLLHTTIPSNLPATLRNALAALTGGNPAFTAHGAERIDWKPKKRRCAQVWANPTVSIPNGIPSMSSASGSAYGLGIDTGGFWGVHALNWRTGRERFFARATPHECSPQVIEWLKQSGIYNASKPILTALPNSCENSFYAATEVGPRGSIWSGTFMGMSIYRPRG